MKEEIKKEAIRIGDELLDRAQNDENGIYWLSMSLGNGGDFKWEKSDSIYSGGSGIILFFIELYKHTNDSKYYDAVVNGSKWIINYCQNTPSKYYAFFTGRIGVSYTLLQVYRLTQEKSYLENALEIAKNAEDFLTSTVECDDLLNGLSGTILGLMFLHEETQESWLLGIINKYLEKILERTHHGEKGLYWDKSVKQMKGGLCGFSHGVSGVGYVFLELGYYFNNDAFYWLAEQAFAYENYHFNETTRNWPDFRKGIYDVKSFEEHKTAFLDDNMAYFTRSGNMAAWCHGAPGIGFSRIKALQRLQKENYKTDLEKAVSYTKKVTYSDVSRFEGTFTLCHGYGGNSMLLLDHYRLTHNADDLEISQKVALKSIEIKTNGKPYASGFTTVNTKEENTSLFMGNAGIGYFYLNVLSPEDTPSVLAPALSKQNTADVSDYPLIKISLVDLKKEIISKSYPKTLFIVENRFKELIDEYLLKQNSENDEKVNFESFVTQLENKISENDFLRIQDLFQLEHFKLYKDIEINWAYVNIKNAVKNELAKKLLTQEHIGTTILEFNQDVFIMENKWNWDMDYKSSWNENFNKPAEDLYTLFQISQNKIVEFFETPDFTIHVFQTFAEAKSVDEGITAILNQFEVDSEDEKMQLKGMILNQIKEGISSLILLVK